MTAKELAQQTVKDIAKRRAIKETELLGYMKDRHSKRKMNYYRKNMGYKY